MSLISDLRRVRALLRHEAPSYAIGLTSLFMVNLCDVVAPVFMAAAVDSTQAVLTGQTPVAPPLMRALGLQAGLSVGLSVTMYLLLQALANIMRYPMLMYVAVPSHRLGQRLRNALARHMLELSRRYYDKARSGDLMSLVTSDIGAVRMMLGPGVLVGGDTILIVSLVLVVLFGLSPTLTLLAMVPLPFIAWITNRLSRREYERFEDVQADVAQLTERARESFAGIRIVQGYAREDYDTQRFERYSWRHLEKQMRLARVRSIFMPTLDLMPGISTVLVLIFGGIQVVNEQMSLGTFVAFLFLVGYLAGPMIGFGWSVTLFQRGRASLNRIESFLDTPIDLTDPAQPVPLTGPGELRVSGLSFAYDGPPPVKDDAENGAPNSSNHAKVVTESSAPIDRRPALQDVSFTLPVGRTLGIIGPVGSGKSTLVSLLVRLYDPPAGAISLDGVDIRDAALDELRAKIVLAPQETFLFSDTVGRNITLADDTGDRMPEEFARHAALHDEILNLKAGYETMLGERGVTLSGGQRQRASIARAIATGGSILILDDCLSAVDARTEEEILRRLRDVFAGRSGIIVSHRIAAVRDCDEILVLQGGCVAERGTHDSLLRSNGYYAATARAQSDEAA